MAFSASDILISAPGGTLGSNFSVDLHLQGTVAGPNTPLTFDTGLPGLPLKIETDGSIGISVNYDFELAFSYDAATHSHLAGRFQAPGRHGQPDCLRRKRWPAKLFGHGHDGFCAGFARGVAGANECACRWRSA